MEEKIALSKEIDSDLFLNELFFKKWASKLGKMYKTEEGLLISSAAALSSQSSQRL